MNEFETLRARVARDAAAADALVAAYRRDERAMAELVARTSRVSAAAEVLAALKGVVCPT